MAKDLRATRDYMRDKRAGTLGGRKWTDYKNGGDFEAQQRAAWKEAVEERKFVTDQAQKLFDRILAENDIVLDSSKYQYGARDSRYMAVRDAIDELRQDVSYIAIDNRLISPDSIYRVRKMQRGMTQKAKADYTNEYNRVTTIVHNAFIKSAYYDKHGRVRFRM